MNEQIEIEERMEWQLVPVSFDCLSCYDTGLGFTDEGDEVLREPCQCDRGRALILNIRPL